MNPFFPFFSNENILLHKRKRKINPKRANEIMLINSLLTEVILVKLPACLENMVRFSNRRDLQKRFRYIE
ncbi:MAG: hypothetical protein AMJ61_01670 [Desulfobacterales bacterium SG8_35_2]|nr:MAG: hypothetical protein AMJ61_01670 [Desulfobacterales bacterium SG8_35_2]